MERLQGAVKRLLRAVARLLAAIWDGVGAPLARGLRRWWPAPVIILVAAGMGAWVLWGRKGAGQTASLLQVYPVERGNLTAAIACTGEVYAVRTAELVFDVTRIPLTELNAAPGRPVKAGEVLARIDPTTLERAVTQTQADLTVAQDAREKAENPYTEFDLTQARLAVSQAELGLVDARKNLESTRTPYAELDVIQARLAVTQSQAALAQAQEALEAVNNPDMGTAQSAVRDAAAALRNARDDLVVAQNDPNNVAKLRTLEYEAAWYQNNYWQAQEKFKNHKIDQQKLDWEYSNMLAAQERLNIARTNAESSLANAQNQVAKAQDAYREARDNLAELQNGPEPSPLAQAQNQVSQAEYNLAKAQADLAKIEAGPDPAELTRAQNQVSQAEFDLAKARADLATIEAGPVSRDVEVAQAKVVSAQAALETAQAALQAATMTAPFEGTVVSTGAAVGDLVSSGTVVVTLADLANLRAKAIVDETDISGLEVGQQVAITFDAFPGLRLQGQVLEVPLQGKLTQNILTYEVPVSLEGGAGVALKPGMTANLSIVVGQRQNVLLVPALAVKQGDQGSVVKVQDSPRSPAVEMRVVLGLSDGMYVEVKQGLNEGDRVVVEYQATQQTPTGQRGANPLGGGGRGIGR